MSYPDAELQRYRAAVQAIPALSREAELALASAYQRHGDRAAAAAVVRANLRQVLPQAVRYRNFGLPLAELIGQGNLALVSALDRFDPERGLRFSTYAKHWIRSEMLALVLQSRSIVGGGRGQLRGRYVFGLRREHAELSTRLGDPDQVVAVLSQRFLKSEDEIRAIVARVEARDASLDLQVGEGHSTLVDHVPSDGLSPEDLFDKRRTQWRLRRELAAATCDLNPRERFIVERRLMADEAERMTLSQIGAAFQVSRERARQLEAGIKAKLRKRLGGLAEQLAIQSAA
jgi:RNA polymerase sigma-32 factor